MQFPSDETVRAIVEAHRDRLTVERVEHIEVASIGQGEANLNVLVTVNGIQHFNLRIGLRGEASEETLQGEYEILQLVPPGLGPRVFVVDQSRTRLPQPYSILEYLPGDLKATWSDADLTAHARATARLHDRAFDRHGRPGQLMAAPFDMLHRFEVALDYWQRREPDLVALPVVRRLEPAVRDFIAGRNPLFTALRTFRIVHGDLHRLNILFHGDRVAYVDWEAAYIGDPAHDLSMLGWDTETPWQFELAGPRLDLFLESYLMGRADPTLRQRRDVWMVYTMFFDQLYHRTQIPLDPTGKQAYTVSQIEAYLTERFLS